MEKYFMRIYDHWTMKNKQLEKNIIQKAEELGYTKWSLFDKYKKTDIILLNSNGEYHYTENKSNEELNKQGYTEIYSSLEVEKELL